MESLAISCFLASDIECHALTVLCGKNDFHFQVAIDRSPLLKEPAPFDLRAILCEGSEHSSQSCSSEDLVEDVLGSLSWNAMKLKHSNWWKMMEHICERTSSSQVSTASLSGSFFAILTPRLEFATCLKDLANRDAILRETITNLENELFCDHATSSASTSLRQFYEMVYADFESPLRGLPDGILCCHLFLGSRPVRTRKLTNTQWLLPGGYWLRLIDFGSYWMIVL